MQMLKAAIVGGANAVYLGLPRFNARMKADNFTYENLSEVISYCHLRLVKVYITFNTMIKESELKDALSDVDLVISLGADAIIVEDLGLLSYIHKAYPDFPLHISTQSGISTVDGVKFAVSLGAKRVILARETSLNDIKLISSSVDCEIEYFVQGALCICYSGNCYFSSIIDGNSGNRGRCMQPCRKKMRLIVGKNRIDGYNLSTKDLCFLNSLDDLKNAGVTSLKIEGRLRSPEYVYYSCRAYSKALNHLDYSQDLENLKIAFNRGDYSEGYLLGRKSKVIYNLVQSNIGKSVGKVIRANVSDALVESMYSPSIGDGFKILRNGAEIGGFSYNNACKPNPKGFIINVKNLNVGDEIRLTFSKINDVEVTAMESKAEIDVKYYISDSRVNFKVELNGEKFEYDYDDYPDYAKSLPLTVEDFNLQFNKFNGTDFAVKTLSGEIVGALFYPKSAINAIRRKLADDLKKDYICRITKSYDKKSVLISDNAVEIKSAIIIKDEIIDLDFTADAKIVRPQDYNNIGTISNNAYLYVPNFLNDNDIKLIEEVIKSNKNIIGIYADGNNAVAFAKNRKIKYIVGTNCNISNSLYALCYGDSIGFANSKELNKNELLENGLALSKGNFSVMTFVHCPLINSLVSTCDNCQYNDEIKYVDEYKREFKLKRNKLSGCLFTLLNNSDVSIDNNHNYLYDFSFLNSSEIKEMLDNPSNSVNKGHYNRGVK